MPDWRENVLSSDESYVDTEIVTYNADRLAGSYPRRHERLLPASTCPYTTIFLGTNLSNSNLNFPKNGKFVDPDLYSVDRSSNLTDTSSFANYEDRRSLRRSLTPDFQLDRFEKRACKSDLRLNDASVTLKIEKVPFTTSVFYVSAKKNMKRGVVGSASDLYMLGRFPGDDDTSDAISSCTCDSFERCEFDCREFEPFSDTCCCDPVDGACTRSPKEVESPLVECCDKFRDEECVSVRSDMDGLDLALFEPAGCDHQCKRRIGLQVIEDKETPKPSYSAVCGILHSIVRSQDAASLPAKVTVSPTWEPYYCVLQQERRTFTAYTSEELATNTSDYTTRSLPRVRLDGGTTAGATSNSGGVRLRCWAAPPSITEEEAEGDEDNDTDASSLQALPIDDTSYEKACRRGSAPSTPLPGGVPQHSPSRLASFFFSKRSFRSNPLKRTKSATKLEREKAALNASQNGNNSMHALRTSRSHESLLSAQSPAVSTMDLGPPHQVEIRALHSSVLGKPHCFALSAENRAARYFACASRKEQDRWIYSLRQAARPDEMKCRRFERSVKLSLLEAKAIPPKKRYYCEIMLDDTLYARSSSKLKTELCFWGEVYEFSTVPAMETITVNLYREPDRKGRKRDKHLLVGSVKIPVDEVSSRYPNERWYPIQNEKITNEKQSPNASQASINGSTRGQNGTNRSQNGTQGSNGPVPSLRIKCRYQCIDVLPLESYAEFSDYLKKNYKKICEYLEPVIGVKAKEDIGGALVLCMAATGLAPRYLADVVALDVRRTGDHSLTFRGNSLATKSMEAYLKLVGDQYLQETLCEAVATTAASECEVDPSRAGGAAALKRQQAALREAVELTWRRISSSSRMFPPHLRDCFATFRERLASMGRDDITDNLISASIFLRFLCPAILSPSLFGITHEYPNERAARNLTLVAKTLQTLANFTRFQGKEAFMEFLNDFLEREAQRMKGFLREISTRLPEQEIELKNKRNSAASQHSDPKNLEEPGRPSRPEPDPEWAPHVDLGKQLAILHTLLADSITKLPPGKLQELAPLADILEDLTNKQESNEQNSKSIPVTDNIFRVIDPTCNPAAKANNEAVAANLNVHANFAHSSPIMTKNGVQYIINTDDNKYKNYQKSPNCNHRSATLPRNNYNGIGNTTVNPERYSTQYNNQEHCVNLKVVQLGFDQYAKGAINGNENDRRFKSNYGPHFINSSNYKTERSPSSDSINHNYSPENMQALIRETANLEELSDLLKYADDAEPEEKVPKNNLQHSHSNNNIVNGTRNHQTNGSNVSISGLSNVASSGYQSIATYSQSSSPIENTNNNMFENGQPLSRYSQMNYQKQRDKHFYDKNKNEKFFSKNPVQQKIEYDIQKYGIQNFTTDNGQSNNNNVSNVGPLIFTNPVYNMENDKKKSPQKAQSLAEAKRNSRCCGSSTSSLDDEGTTDNMETNSDDASTKFIDKHKKFDRHSRSNNHRKLTRDTTFDGDYQKVYKDDESSNPSLRKSANKTRMPRTNPMLSYNSGNNQLNLKHFGQRGDSLYENKPHLITTESNYPMTRSDSNVEEVNKEMYRLQISRSQKALYNMENAKNIPEKFTLDKNEQNFPLERNYSAVKLSSSRLNEELDNVRHQDVYYCIRERDSPSSATKTPIYLSNSIDSPALGSDKSSKSKEKLQRRLSLESARELSDSSTDMEDSHYCTTERRRASKHQRTIEQYEREIERLKCSVKNLRGKLGIDPSLEQTDAKMKAVVSRLISAEEELRQEQRKMSAALSHKQRVIEAQEHRIAALDEANTRLLSALVHLQQKAPHPPTQHSHTELQI